MNHRALGTVPPWPVPIDGVLSLPDGSVLHCGTGLPPVPVTPPIDPTDPLDPVLGSSRP
jgi:hypothetical protein